MSTPEQGSKLGLGEISGGRGLLAGAAAGGIAALAGYSLGKQHGLKQGRTEGYEAGYLKAKDDDGDIIAELRRELAHARAELNQSKADIHELLEGRGAGEGKVEDV